jgi:dipeptidyl aminopeptidase/acylaminoacyl peptidase
LVKPQIFSFVSTRHGQRIYGCVYRPPAFDPARKYPVLVDVYGGPHVQQITDSYSLTFRMSRQMYAGLGMIVVVIDSVGSDNRGMAFESLISEKMGTVEVPDQTEGLMWLADHGEPLDMTRVAITGWSYGGYVSLLALAQ